MNSSYDNLVALIDDPTTVNGLEALREILTHLYGIQFLAYGTVSSGLYLNALDAIDYDFVNSLLLTAGLLILWSPGISYVYYLLFGLTGVEWILRQVSRPLTQLGQ